MPTRRQFLRAATGTAAGFAMAPRVHAASIQVNDIHSQLNSTRIDHVVAVDSEAALQAALSAAFCSKPTTATCIMRVEKSNGSICLRCAAWEEDRDYVLIACEGGKSEPNYFRRLREVHRLSSANVEIARANGNDPVSLVAYTEMRLTEGGFDHAYCVFDRDGHANYNQAIQMVANSPNGRIGRLRAITSIPCFEIWVLLHFRYSSAAFNSAGSQSACDRVIAEVTKHFADYSKGHKGVYDRLEALMNQAHTHAERLVTENAATGSTNPATRVHELVGYLCNLKK